MKLRNYINKYTHLYTHISSTYA